MAQNCAFPRGQKNRSLTMAYEWRSGSPSNCSPNSLKSLNLISIRSCPTTLLPTLSQFHLQIDHGESLRQTRRSAVNSRREVAACHLTSRTLGQSECRDCHIHRNAIGAPPPPFDAPSPSRDIGQVRVKDEARPSYGTPGNQYGLGNDGGDSRQANQAVCCSCAPENTKGTEGQLNGR